MRYVPTALLLLTAALPAQLVKSAFNPANGHHYSLYYSLNPWTSVPNWMGQQQMVTIRNKAENDWIVKTFASVVSGDILIGLNDHEREGTWVWAGNTSPYPYTYRNWRHGTPRAASDFTTINFFDGMWDEHPVCAFRHILIESYRPTPYFYYNIQQLRNRACGSTTPYPYVAASGPPQLGFECLVTAHGFKPNKPGFVVFGASKLIWGSTPLPLSLSGMGAGSCLLHVSFDVVKPILTDKNGSCFVLYHFVTVPMFASIRCHGQVFAQDFAANPLGLAATGRFELLADT